MVIPDLFSVSELVEWWETISIRVCQTDIWDWWLDRCFSCHGLAMCKCSSFFTNYSRTSSNGHVPLFNVPISVPVDGHLSPQRQQSLKRIQTAKRITSRQWPVNHRRKNGVYKNTLFYWKRSPNLICTTLGWSLILFKFYWYILIVLRIHTLKEQIINVAPRKEQVPHCTPIFS